MQIPRTGALSKMDAPSRHLHSVPAAEHNTDQQLSARKHQLTADWHYHCCAQRACCCLHNLLCFISLDTCFLILSFSLDPTFYRVFISDFTCLKCSLPFKMLWYVFIWLVILLCCHVCYSLHILLINFSCMSLLWDKKVGLLYSVHPNWIGYCMPVWFLFMAPTRIVF